MTQETGELQARFTEMMGEVDREVGAARFDRSLGAERLIRKLELIMTDEDLTLALGAYMRNLVLAGQLGLKKISQEQADRVEEVINATFHRMAHPPDPIYDGGESRSIAAAP